VAAAPAAPAAAAPSAPAVAAAAPAGPPVGWMNALVGALDRAKDVGFAARTRRSQGVALVAFAMRRDGSLVSSRLVRSSGDEEMDAAALAQLQRARLPAPPADYGGEVVQLTVPIRFSVTR
ncbi:energy transducer TonB family protein, partial [Roseomonas sp. BN140053]|uniref:energy transducer TonB family protein n=1 Tax=Roseomonas sp. BN140053 TaxID=3391898 RepID=UPI0039ED706F